MAIGRVYSAMPKNWSRKPSSLKSLATPLFRPPPSSSNKCSKSRRTIRTSRRAEPVRGAGPAPSPAQARVREGCPKMERPQGPLWLSEPSGSQGLFIWPATGAAVGQLAVDDNGGNPNNAVPLGSRGDSRVLHRKDFHVTRRTGDAV